MKYILKIFLIVLLVVAIIGAACWFFLVQRPDLTMSVFAHWGDYFYDAGRYNRAVSLYETACKLSPENANLPVRLAQAYINSGNYTKAEYTLVSAITNNPESVQLYVGAFQNVYRAGQDLRRGTDAGPHHKRGRESADRCASPKCPRAFARKRILQRIH